MKLRDKMIRKTREVLKKLEFGMLELLVGLLMVAGLIGYFWFVPADIEWLDHTVSFILFSYLFYKVGITSLLFGHRSRNIEKLIVVSYFLLFFKDIIIYTKQTAFKFTVLKFVDYFYVFFSSNEFVSVFMTFYIGILGLVIAAVYITRNMVIGHPSFLFAFKQKPFKNNAFKFLAVFVALLGFYYSRRQEYYTLCV